MTDPRSLRSLAPTVPGRAAPRRESEIASIALLLATATACATPASPAARPTTSAVTEPSGRPLPPTATPAGDADIQLYTLEEAFADVMSSPLAFIGTGEWYGVAPYPPCAYKNARVIVLDNYCTTRKEISTFGVDIYSPTKGWFEIYATARGGKPVSQTPRSEYGSFIITSGPAPKPGQVKVALSFDMSYPQIERYEGARAGAHLPACWEGVHAHPASGCSNSLPESVARAFKATYQDFMRNPPQRWYDFARYIIAQRRHPWPKPAGFQVTPDYLRGRAVDFARQNGLHLTQSHWNNVGNVRGLFTAVSATRDGGFIVIGNKAANVNDPPSGVPVVVRVDSGGGGVWETSLRRNDFQDFEASSFVATPDGGVIAHVLSYKAAGAGAVNRLVKLDRAGAIVWDWVGRGHGYKDTPFARTLQLTRGRIYMTGHVYREGADLEYAWTGEVDAATGTLIKDEVGAIDPYKRKRN